MNKMIKVLVIAALIAPAAMTIAHQVTSSMMTQCGEANCPHGGNDSQDASERDRKENN